MDFEALLKLFRLTHSFAKVERSVKILDRASWESDPEYSYQLALLGWYVSDALELKLNRQKIFEYALVHDLVEVYAGDTDPHKHSQEFIATKHERETRAMQILKQDFPKFTALQDALKNFAELKEDEAKFVYLLDKIVPIINTYIAGDSYYRDNNVSFEKWRDWLENKKSKAQYQQKEFKLLLNQVSGFFQKIETGFFK